MNSTPRAACIVWTARPPRRPFAHFGEASFARHYKTGQPIPPETVEQMNRATHFGEAVLTRRQLWPASISFAYENGDGNVDTDAVAKSLYSKILGMPFPDGMHGQCSFTHLGNPGYAGTYYTYQWSLVIAKDLFMG